MATKTKTKVCTTCERRLPITKFHKDSSIKGGRRSRCGECRQALRANKTPPYKEHEKVEKSDREIEAEAIRNSLLILRKRHPEEYMQILRGQRWQLQMRHGKRTDQWREMIN